MLLLLTPVLKPSSDSVILAYTVSRTILALPFGLVFGGFGGACRRGPLALIRVCLVCLIVLPVGATLFFQGRHYVQNQCRIVAQFPAAHTLGLPVAFTVLDDPKGFIWFAAGAEGQTIHLFKGRVGGEVKEEGRLAVPELLEPIQSERASFAASPTWLAGGTERGVVVWNHRTRQVVRSTPCTSPTRFPVVALSPTDEFLAYAFGAEEPQVFLASVKEPSDLVSFRPKVTAPISCLRFSHDGRLLAAGSGYKDLSRPTKGGEVFVVDVPSRQAKGLVHARGAVCAAEAHPRVGITSVAFWRKTLYKMGPGDESQALAGAQILATMNRRSLCRAIWTWDGHHELDHRTPQHAFWRTTTIMTACAYSEDYRGFATGDVEGYIYFQCAEGAAGIVEGYEMPYVGRSVGPVRLLQFLGGSEYLAANEFVLFVGDLPEKTYSPGFE